MTIEDIGEQFSGLRASPEGGWAQYEFDITYPGRYQILVEYAEYGTMFHHSANIAISVDDEKLVQTTLFPTLHSYVVSGKDVDYSRSSVMADRHALWMTGAVDLTEGRHTLRLLMEPLGISNEQTDRYSDARYAFLPGQKAISFCHREKLCHTPSLQAVGV